jgi:hypothetical protein
MLALVEKFAMEIRKLRQPLAIFADIRFAGSGRFIDGAIEIGAKPFTALASSHQVRGRLTFVQSHSAVTGIDSNACRYSKIRPLT